MIFNGIGSLGGIAFYRVGLGFAGLHGHRQRPARLPQLDPEPEAVDTSFCDFEYSADIQHRCGVLLRRAGPAFHYDTAGVPDVGWTASLFRNGHLHLRRHRPGPPLTEGHEATAGF